MMALIPIFIIGLLIFLFVLLRRRAFVFFSKVFYGKRIRWTISGYVIILLIATGAFYITPKPESFGEEDAGLDNSEDVDESIHQIYDDAHNGTMSDEYDLYIKQKEEIELADHTLALGSVSGESIPVFVDEKDENDGMVGATLYSTPTLVNGVDITDEIPDVRIETSSNEVTLIPPEETEVSFTSFEREFSLTQFTGERNRLGVNIERGGSLLYLRVPKNSELEYPEHMDITYAGEE